MARWKQETVVTYTDGTMKTYSPKIRTADRMVEMLAQVSFLKQAGEYAELTCDVDDEDYSITAYHIFRKMKDRSVENIFTRVE